MIRIFLPKTTIPDDAKLSVRDTDYLSAVESGEMKKKGLSQRGLGSFVPALLNESPFFDDSVSQPDDSVNGKFSAREDIDEIDLSQYNEIVLPRANI